MHPLSRCPERIWRRPCGVPGAMAYSPLLVNYSVCTCFFVEYISSMTWILRNLYTWEKSLFIWYRISIEPACFSSIILWWLQICLVSACLISICIFAHSHFIEDLCLHAYHGEHVDFYFLNVLSSSWLFQLVLVSNWHPWACERILLKILLCILVGPTL